MFQYILRRLFINLYYGICITSERMHWYLPIFRTTVASAAPVNFFFQIEKLLQLSSFSLDDCTVFYFYKLFFFSSLHTNIILFDAYSYFFILKKKRKKKKLSKIIFWYINKQIMYVSKVTTPFHSLLNEILKLFQKSYIRQNIYTLLWDRDKKKEYISLYL